MKKFLTNTDGNYSVILAIIMIPMVLAAGGAVDVSRAYNQDSNLQAAVDGAVLAVAAMAGNTETERRQMGEKHFLSNAQNPCNNNITFTFESDRVTGEAACAVETVLLRVGGMKHINLKSTSVASWRATPIGDGCIYALDTANVGQSLSFNSMDLADLHDCVPVSNSPKSDGFKVNSVDTYKAASVYSAGGFVENSVDNFVVANPPLVNKPPLPDPYANVPEPWSPASCTQTGYNSSTTYFPGVYCGELKIENASVNFKAGTYYIVDGDFHLNSLNTVTCDCTSSGKGVTFVLTGTDPSKIGRFEINSVYNFNLRAPSEAAAPFPGILFYVDRDAPKQKSIFNSVDTMIANGAIYAPSHELVFSSIDASLTDCGHIIGLNVEFNSIDGFSGTNNCTDYGMKNLTIAGGDPIIRLIR